MRFQSRAVASLKSPSSVWKVSGQRLAALHPHRHVPVGERIGRVEADADNVLRPELGLGFEAAPVVDQVEVAVLHQHRHGEVVVGDVRRHVVEPRKIALAEVHELADDHLDAVGDLVRPGVEQADAALATHQEAVLRRRRHELRRRAVQRIAGLAAVGVRFEHLELTLRQNLAAVAELLVGDVAVVAVPGELQALPEVHQIDEVFGTASCGRSRPMLISHSRPSR